MDELLQSRIAQLKAIEDRLDATAKKLAAGKRIETELAEILVDIRFAIAKAEREHAEF